MNWTPSTCQDADYVLDAVPEAYVRLDGEFRHRFVSRVAEGLFARGRAELLGRVIWEAEPALAGTPFQHDCRLAMTERIRMTFGSYLEFQQRWYEVTATPDAGDGIVLRFEDTTARKQAQEALRRSEDRIRLLAHTLQCAGECISITDTEDRILYANHAFLRTYGYSEEELIGRHVGILRSGRTAAVITDEILPATIEGNWCGQLWNRTKQGREFPISLVTSAVYDENGRRIALVGIARDITESKRAEEALKESEDNFRTFFESMSDMIVVASPEGRILYANAATVNTLGYSYTELDAMRLVDLHPAELRREAESIFAAMLRGEQDFCPLPVASKDGRVVPVDIRAWSGRWSGAECIFGICKNLTAEQEAKQRFERLFRHNPALMALSTLPDRRFEDVNNAWLDLLGYSREEVIGKTNADLDLFVDAGQQEAVADQLQSEGRVSECEIQVRRKDGSVRHGLFTGDVIRSQGKQYFQTVMIDITGRKRAEEALRESERRAVRQRTAIAQLALDKPMAGDDLAGALERIAEVMSATLGVARASIWKFSGDRSEARCLALYDAGEKTHSRGAVFDTRACPCYFEAITTDSRIDAEDARTDPRTSELRDAYLIPLGITSMLDAGILMQGQLAGVVCLEHIGARRRWQPDEGAFAGTAASMVAQLFESVDRRRAEETLRKSEEKFRMLYENAPALIDGFDKNGRCIFWNRECERVFGWTMEEVNSWEEPLALFYPDPVVRGRALNTVTARPEKVFREWHPLTKEGRELTVLWANFQLPDGTVINIGHDITAQRKAEDALRESALMLSRTEEIAHIGSWEYHVAENQLTWSDETYRIFGLEPREFNATYEAFLAVVHPEDRAAVDAAYSKSLREGQDGYEIDHRVVRPRAGEVREVREKCLHEKGASGAIVRSVGIVHDITEHKRAEQERQRLQTQLVQAQKMESIGRLSGGVAHDFNNLLTVINGYSQLIQAGLAQEDPLRERLSQIQRAGERAAGLTRQLLAFSRKQVLEPCTLDLNRLVEEMRPMLERLVGEDVRIRVAPGARRGMVRADPHQLELVIMNLAVNARDAMPRGGKLSIGTDVVVCDEGHTRLCPEARAGNYVLLTVRDNGMGMGDETRQRIFEPFFTTKALGQGTGLGLAMVQGIVEQSGGWIDVSSESGQGSTFKIYLPETVEPSMDAGGAAEVAALGGAESILVVEDQTDVRDYVTTVLKAYGYRVMTSQNAGEALLMFEQEHGRVHLILTDVVMPNTSGRELAARLKNLHAGVKVLYMSGYSDNVIEQHGVLEEGVHFIQKPFSPEALAAKVREALGSPATT